MTETTAIPATSGRIATLLAILSVLGFWLLPFSPIVAIAALAATCRSTGWVRQTAVTGAVLSAGFTVGLASLIVWLTFTIPFEP